MPPHRSSVAERLAVVRMTDAGQTLATASATLGFSPDWGRKWWRRYQQGGEAAPPPAPPPPPGPLARFSPAVADAVLAVRYWRSDAPTRGWVPAGRSRSWPTIPPWRARRCRRRAPSIGRGWRRGW